jgi:uncharacterized protein (DUF302 family)
MLVKRSDAGYGETLRRLDEAIERRGLTEFARIDHAAAARAAGLEMADELVVLFGNPRAGTPLMQSDPRVGIELPLRMLIWSDAKGTLVGHDDPRELATRYELADNAGTLEQMAVLLTQLVGEVTAAAG